MSQFGLNKMMLFSFDIVDHEAGENRTCRHSFDPSDFVGDDELMRVALEIIVGEGLRYATLRRTLHVLPTVEAYREATTAAYHVVGMITAWTGLDIFRATKAHNFTSRHAKPASPFPVVVAELRRMSECVYRLSGQLARIIEFEVGEV